MIAIVLAVLSALSLPAHGCLTEDGQPRGNERACIWNARTMGNGQGRSFVAVDGATTRTYFYDNGDQIVIVR